MRLICINKKLCSFKNNVLFQMYILTLKYETVYSCSLICIKKFQNLEKGKDNTFFDKYIKTLKIFFKVYSGIFLKIKDSHTLIQITKALKIFF